MKIQSIDRDIRYLFTSSFYKVPRFQRPYSWTKENIDEFWLDIIESADDEYFIGSMVVYKEKVDTYGIVDGQQRMTTITMVLCALRELMRSAGLSEIADGVHQTIERKDINENKPHFVLQTETSYPYLQEAIQKHPQKTITLVDGSEEKKIQDAYAEIKSKMKEHLKKKLNVKELPHKADDHQTQELKWLRDKVLSLKVIFIDLDNEDDAYVVFETLNARGKDLSISDLVKSHITKNWQMKNARVDRASDKWKEIITILDGAPKNIDIDDFLLHYWISKHKHTSKKELFGLIKKYVNKDNVEEFVDELIDESKAYRTIFDPCFYDWDKQERQIFKSLKALTIFQVKQPTPLLLATLVQIRHKKISLKNAKAIFSAIEVFHFISTAIISQSSSGGTSTLYSKAARDLRITNKTNLGDITRKFVDKIKNKTPSQKEFSASFIDVGYSEKHSKNKKLAQYILEKFDSHNKKDPIDYDQMTIEHIASQSDKAISELEISKIGNLLYVSSELNEKLKNSDFSKKKPKLTQHITESTDCGISNATKWGVNEINDRSQKMSDKAYNEIWTY